MHNCNIFDAQMRHMHTCAHKIHHSPNLGEATTFLLIVFFVLGHGACTQMSFCPGTPKLGVPKFSKLGLPWLWRPIIFCVDLWLKWGLKWSYSPCRKLFNNMWHVTCMQVNQGDSRLLMVGNQIGSLTPCPSFDHNMCFKWSNGTCKLILDIQVLRAFQWHKEIFNPMSFDPCNYPLKTPSPKVEAHLGVCGFIPSHPPTFPRAWNVIPRFHSLLTPLQALALVVSLKLRSR